MERLRGITESGLLRKQKEFIMYAVPTWLMAIIELGLGSITLVFAGQLGKTMLAGVGLGNTLTIVLLWSILWGFLSVMDTYGPQVYASSKKNGLGTVTFKTLLQGGLIYILFLGVYLNSGHIVKILPPDIDASPSNCSQKEHGSAFTKNIPEPVSVQVVTIKYIRYVCLVPLFDFFIAIISRYLVIQQYIYQVYICSAAMILMHVIFNYLLVIWCDLALVGLATAALLSRLLTLVLFLGVCWAKRKHLAWSGYSAAVCSNWSETIKLGLSGAANMFLELGTYEAAVFLSKFNGTAVMATTVIFMQFFAIFFTFACGLGTATSILIGKALQGKNKSQVLSYMRIASVNSLIVSVGITLAFYLLRVWLCRIFTSDPDVIGLLISAAWILLIQIPTDHLQSVLGRGILVSFGRQRFAAMSLALFSFLVCIPLMVIFVFLTDLGPTGILVALTVMAVLNLATVAVKIFTLDINMEIQLSEKRAMVEENDTPYEVDEEDDAESMPLTALKRKLTDGEKTVLIWTVFGFVTLGSLVSLSFL